MKQIKSLIITGEMRSRNGRRSSDLNERITDQTNEALLALPDDATVQVIPTFPTPATPGNALVLITYSASDEEAKEAEKAAKAKAKAEADAKKEAEAEAKAKAKAEAKAKSDAAKTGANA
jgi:hypothetical protein